MGQFTVGTMCRTFVILSWFTSILLAAPKLGNYKVDSSSISVSGLSSGANMAVQYHVAHSASIMGAGVVAGVPYLCSGGLFSRTVWCSQFSWASSISLLARTTRNLAAAGDIDPVSGLSGDRVFIFNGVSDLVINVNVGKKVKEFYEEFGSVTKGVFNMSAAHGFPTKNRGGVCNRQNLDFINNCDYDGSFHILDHIYGALTVPSGDVNLTGNFLEFDQSEFFYISPPAASSMATQGFLYVPSGCTDQECKLHVVFHGCSQSQRFVGDKFARTAGYNEVGELNNIIILYPQTTLKANNPLDCWDWWGYNGPLFATKSGNQILAVERMIQRVMGQGQQT